MFICDTCVAGSTSHTDPSVGVIACAAVEIATYSGFDDIAMMSLAIRVFQPFAFAFAGCLRALLETCNFMTIILVV